MNPIESDISNKNKASQQFWKGLTEAVGLYGSFMAITGLLLSFSDATSKLSQILKISFSILGFIVSIISFLHYYNQINGLTKSLCDGLTIGFCINMLAAIIPALAQHKIDKKIWKNLITGAGIVRTIVSIYANQKSLYDEVDLQEFWTNTKYAINSAALILAILSFMMIKDEDIRDNASLAFTMIAFNILLVLCQLPSLIDMEPY